MGRLVDRQREQQDQELDENLREVDLFKQGSIKVTKREGEVKRGAWCLVPGASCVEVRGASCRAPGASCVEVRGASCRAPGAWCVVPWNPALRPRQARPCTKHLRAPSTAPRTRHLPRTRHQ